MSETKRTWIDLETRAPDPGQFVRVEVRERVENHWIHFEGQARFQAEQGWSGADGREYLKEGQEIRRWRPLLDSGGHEEWEEFLGDLPRD